MNRADAPHWQRRAQHLNAAIPAKLKDWLCEKRSLIRRLQRHCRQPVTLEVISQRWEHPLADERPVLNMSPGRLALVRQVRLRCGERPLIFARSVIPSQALRSATRRLSRLGTRPLADLLVTHRSIRRGEMDFTQLQPGHVLYELSTQALQTKAEILWGRRALFRFRHKPLLICEIFSPTIVDADG